MCKYEVIKGYHVESDEIEKETMRYLRIFQPVKHIYGEHALFTNWLKYKIV